MKAINYVHGKEWPNELCNRFPYAARVRLIDERNQKEKLLYEVYKVIIVTFCKYCKKMTAPASRVTWPMSASMRHTEPKMKHAPQPVESNQESSANSETIDSAMYQALALVLSSRLAPRELAQCRVSVTLHKIFLVIVKFQSDPRFWS